MGRSFKDVLCGVCSALALGPALASLQIFKSLTFVSGWYKGVHVLLPYSKRLGEKMTQKKVSRKDFSMKKASRIPSQGPRNSVASSWRKVSWFETFIVVECTKR